MEKFRYLLITCGLIIGLWGPFILKIKNNRLEVFPSIVLPSGASKAILIDDKYSYAFTELYAFDKNKSLVEVDKRKFFEGIPIQNYIPLTNRYLDLENYSITFKLYKPPISFTQQNYLTDEKTDELKYWIRNRLQKQNLSDSIVVFRDLKFEINKGSGKIVSKDSLSEKVFKLR